MSDLGLAESLSQYGRTLEAVTDGRLSVAVDVDVLELSPAAEVACFRIVTEALTNVLRHSGASSANVTVHASDRLSIRVSDNGTSDPSARPGTGLTSMRQRAEELGGRCIVDFRRPRGTVVAAIIPLADGVGT